jgi:hypothetical protein
MFILLVIHELYTIYVYNQGVFDVSQTSVNGSLYGKDDQESPRYESPLWEIDGSPGANYGEEKYIDKQ